MRRELKTLKGTALSESKLKFYEKPITSDVICLFPVEKFNTKKLYTPLQCFHRITRLLIIVEEIAFRPHFKP